MQSGKDVYCEKPLTLTIDEGQEDGRSRPPLRHGLPDRQPAAQRQALPPGVRTGAQRHASASCKRVDTYIGDIDGGSWQPVTTPPPELDWNFWLGPAP